MRDSNLGKIYWKHLVISLNYMTLDNVNVLDVFFYSDLSSKKYLKTLLFLYITQDFLEFQYYIRLCYCNNEGPTKNKIKKQWRDDYLPQHSIKSYTMNILYI